MKIAPPMYNNLDGSFHELHYIYLHPDNFRMGIGTYEVRFAFDIARNLGICAKAFSPGGRLCIGRPEKCFIKP